MSKLLLGQTSKLLPLQHEPFHTVQVFVPLLHQLLSLDRKHEEQTEVMFLFLLQSEQRLPSVCVCVKCVSVNSDLCQRHGRLPGEEESSEVGFHLVFLLRVLLHL